MHLLPGHVCNHQVATMGAYFAPTHLVCNSKGITNRVNRRGICLPVFYLESVKYPGSLHKHHKKYHRGWASVPCRTPGAQVPGPQLARPLCHCCCRSRPADHCTVPYMGCGPHITPLQPLSPRAPQARWRGCRRAPRGAAAAAPPGPAARECWCPSTPPASSCK